MQDGVLNLAASNCATSSASPMVAEGIQQVGEVFVRPRAARAGNDSAAAAGCIPRGHGRGAAGRAV